MPIPLSNEAIEEKNKLIADGVWLLLLEINLKNPETTFRIAHDTSKTNITWNGQTWVMFPFNLGEIPEDSKGSTASVQLKVSNVKREMEQYVDQADGVKGATVTVYVVHSKHLNLTNPMTAQTFSVISVKADFMDVTFDLGFDYPLMTRRPEKRIMKNFCEFAYGGPQCAVAPLTMVAFPTCGKTLANCRARNNSVRFGGEPSLPTNEGLYL